VCVCVCVCLCVLAQPDVMSMVSGELGDGLSAE